MSLIPRVFNNRNVFDPFSLDLWDPFLSSSGETSAIINAQIDWKETPEAHVFKADLPGMKKEEVKVEVEEGMVLQISGERNFEKGDKNDKLPENAKVDDVKASMENGVLTVTVPKEEVKRPEVKFIEITG
ncbi:Alpha crystallin/Hsp20 domain [Dillenia turbinata]|uniref:Alpha crystallin/Hsp20 domain n=1 Tax=Dillenia turbinata TaxID=194707 RepID=A0AAN8V5G9_9MAGN